MDSEMTQNYGDERGQISQFEAEEIKERPQSVYFPNKDIRLNNAED